MRAARPGLQHGLPAAQFGASGELEDGKSYSDQIALGTALRKRYHVRTRARHHELQHLSPISGWQSSEIELERMDIERE